LKLVLQNLCQHSCHVLDLINYLKIVKVNNNQPTSGGLSGLTSLFMKTFLFLIKVLLNLFFGRKRRFTATGDGKQSLLARAHVGWTSLQA